MIVSDAASALLAGPRGRRLCLELSGVNPLEVLARLSVPPRGSRQTTQWLDVAPYPAGIVAQIAADIGERWRGEDHPVLTETELWSALDLAVAFATYWQPADENDEAAADPRVVEALAPVADAVVRHRLGQRWARPSALADQAHVSWADAHGRPVQPLVLTGTAGRLSTWRTSARRDVPGSQWWSTPAMHAIVTTTGERVAGSHLGLVFVEDAQGWSRARVVALRPVPEARVLRITGPQNWIELVRRHPLDVTRAHAQPWREATELDGPWLIPDWAAVADEYDGVHLTIMGYLTTAGRALPVGWAHTLLGGWDPDATYWLTDCLEPQGPAKAWIRDDDSDADDDEAFGWHPASVH